ncbi:EF-hand domain-containing protein [Thermaurantiacus sp.]
MRHAAVAILLLATPALAQPGKFFDIVDTNRDGAISAAEWKASGRPPEGFRMMDTNRDGKVTRAEGRAAMEKMRAARPMAAPR